MASLNSRFGAKGTTKGFKVLIRAAIGYFKKRSHSHSRGTETERLKCSLRLFEWGLWVAHHQGMRDEPCHRVRFTRPDLIQYNNYHNLRSTASASHSPVSILRKRRVAFSEHSIDNHATQMCGVAVVEMEPLPTSEVVVPQLFSAR